jgi:drug/metabolite transporter (DMT)-like permease
MSEPPAGARLARVSPYLLLALAPLFWSANWLVGRGLHDAVPPMAMTFFRWCFALAFMLPFALPHVVRDWAGVRAGWRMLIVLGVLGISSHSAFSFLGLNYTTATNGVVINSFAPVLIVALSWIILRERLTRMQLAGVLVSVVGVLMILTRGNLGALYALRLNIGDLFVLTSMLIWAAFTICLRWRPPGLHPLTFLFVIACVGTIQMLPLYLGEAALGRQVEWSWRVVGAFSILGLFSSFIGYVFWNAAVAQVGANVAGLFVHLLPVYGTLLAWLLLDERVAWFHFVGIAMIIAGIWVTSRYAPGRGRSPAHASPRSRG